MKRIILLIFSGVVIVMPAFSQVNWESKLPDNIGLVENLGRYDQIMGEEILFHARSGKHTYFISNDAIIIGEQEVLSAEEIHEKKEKLEHGESIKPIPWNYFKIEFSEANVNCEISPVNKRPYTSNFQDPKNTKVTIVAPVYKGVIIKNIYEGINLHVVMDLEIGGLKYLFECRPNADLGDIQMVYHNITPKINSDGSLSLTSDIFTFNDREPYSWLGDFSENDTHILTKFQIIDNKVGFNVAEHDRSNQTLIIDPWLTSPLSFTTVQKGVEVGYDDSGNCYVMGNAGAEVVMYDNTGAFQWIWTGPAPGFMEGDMCTKPSSNECFFTYTAAAAPDPTIFRFNDAGVVTASYLLSTNPTDPGELWRISYDVSNDQIVLGSGGVFDDAQVTLIDVGLTTTLNYSAYFGLSAEDVVSIRPDQDGTSIYYMISTAPNHVTKVQMADPATFIWDNTTTGHTYAEAMSVQFTGGGFIVTNGMNAMVHSDNFLYTWDGDLLNQYNDATGAITNSLNIGVAPFFSGGVAYDPCGNIYIGLTDSIRIYDESLNYQGGYDTPGPVYDLEVGNGNLYASGENFVMEITIGGGSANLNMAATTTQCSACDGTATVDTSFACPGYFVDDITWSPGGGSTVMISNLCAGWYTSQVTWINGLGDTIVGLDSVEVIDNGASITVTEAFTDVSCPGSCDGTITLTPTSGSSPYVFDIGTQTNGTGTFTGLCAQAYNITVTDNNGCQYTSIITVGAGSGGISVTEAFTNESCPGSCDGTITLTPTSGVAPFVFDIGTQSNGTGTFTGLCVGNFVITVTDNNGCDYNGNINIGSSGGLGLDTVSTNRPTCNGFNDGSITVTATGGNPPITYTWTPTNPVPGATFNNLTAGTYLVVATDQSGGCEDSLYVTLVEPDSIFASLELTHVLCAGDQTGIAEVLQVFNAQGDLNNISYFWNPNPGGQGGLGADSTGSMSAGNYTLTINDDFGCSVLQDFTITEPDSLYLSQFGSEPAYCRLFGYQNGNGVLYVAASGGTAGYDYQWTNLTTLQTSPNSTWGGLNPGSYQVVVTDNNGCLLTEFITLDSLNPVAAFDVISPQLDQNCEGTEIVNAQFNNQSLYFANPNNPLADTTFFWNFNFDKINWIISHDVNQVFDTSYTGEAIYEVCLIALNKNGCADTACKTLIVHAMPEIIPPNIFTPDGGNENEVFTFENYATAITEFHCVIVNRWGVTISELNAITESWDGTDQSGSTCPEGVYFYSYEAISTNGTNFEGQGTVQLIRGN